MTKIETALLIFLGINLGFLGSAMLFLTNTFPFDTYPEYYGDGNCSYLYDGCWASVQSGDSAGDWVCVNIKDMDYKRAYDICRHEVAHEIFAESAETDKNFLDKLADMGIA